MSGAFESVLSVRHIKPKLREIRRHSRSISFFSTKTVSLLILITTQFTLGACRDLHHGSETHTAPPSMRSTLLSGKRSAMVDSLEDSVKTPNWVVFLPGSGCSLLKIGDSRWEETARKTLHANSMVINKVGVTSAGTCDHDAFLHSSTRDQRIADALEVFQSQLPKDANITLIAESEGGYFAPSVVRAEPRIKSLILISAGTRTWIDEEIQFVPPAKRKALREFFEREVIPNPVFDRVYNGWSFAELVSYQQPALTDLRQLQLPVLMVNGGYDHQTWVAATKNDVEGLMRDGQHLNLRFKWFPDADHGLHCDAHALNCQEPALANQLQQAIESFLLQN